MTCRQHPPKLLTLQRQCYPDPHDEDEDGSCALVICRGDKPLAEPNAWGVPTGGVTPDDITNLVAEYLRQAYPDDAARLIKLIRGVFRAAHEAPHDTCRNP